VPGRRVGTLGTLISFIASFLCVAVLLCFGLVFGSSIISSIEYNADKKATIAKTGQPAPDFVLKNIAGQAVRLSDYNGHPRLINFWTTWCGPCREEMPILQARYSRWAPRLVIIGIDECEKPTDALTYVTEYLLTFPVVIDEDCKIGPKDYLIGSYPTSFFVDQTGIIRSVIIGSMTSETLDQNLFLIGVGY
jgi:thiol-disulfide isomerase/thioredoxin